MSTDKIITALLITLALSFVVMAALATGAFWALVGGMIVVGLVSIALSVIGVNLFGRWTDARIKARAVEYSHVEAMAKMGLLRESDQYRMLPEPDYSDVPVSTSGETANTVTQYQAEAVELLAASTLWLRNNTQRVPSQIIPYREAKSFEYFRSGEGFTRWQNGIKYLILQALATEKMNGKKKEGTFLKVGTVEQLYNSLKTASPTLPAAPRN